MMLPMTIRRALSRVQHIANVAPLRAAVLGALLCCPAAAQGKGQEVYPDPPPGPPPVSKVEGSEATDEASMKAYAEAITGTDVTFKLTPIPGGEFLMGSPADEEGRNAFEGPQVKVRVSPFWMGTHEVAWREYSQYMDSLRSCLKNHCSFFAASWKPMPLSCSSLFGFCVHRPRID